MKTLSVAIDFSFSDCGTIGLLDLGQGSLLADTIWHKLCQNIILNIHNSTSYICTLVSFDYVEVNR